MRMLSREGLPRIVTLEDSDSGPSKSFLSAPQNCSQNPSRRHDTRERCRRIPTCYVNAPSILSEPNDIILFKTAKDNAMRTARSTINVKKRVVSSALLIAVLSPCIAAAALGEPETSVQTDAEGLRGSIKVTPHASYRL